MAEYIEREAFIAEQRHLYCENCERRKGMKNGKKKFVYAIGEVPCRACDIGDMLDSIEDYPAADVRPVVLCKDCRHRDPEDHKCDSGEMERQGCPFKVADNYFCAYGER